MNAAVQRLEAVPGRRVVAVSDVHGNLPLLKGLLETVSLCGEDLLLLVGDIVEKGPQSLATLRYLLDLRRRVPVAGVIGNCDLGVLQALEGEDAFRSLLALRQKHQLPGLLQEMLEEQGLAPGEAEDVRPCIRLLNERYREELAFLRGLPTVLSAPHHLFVHAGLPTRPPCPRAPSGPASSGTPSWTRGSPSPSGWWSATGRSPSTGRTSPATRPLSAGRRASSASTAATCCARTASSTRCSCRT